MDFKDQIKEIAGRIDKLKDSLLTEEATKNALIMPFLMALGYDIFNPLEVLPEMCCDIGTKKGEKIDYAIMRDGKPIILIECKHWKQDLNLHDNQLLRYFNVSGAKFGLLTNGIIYRFYTDLESPNKMDEKPFLEVNMLDLKDVQIEELKKFHKSYFDLDNILNSASELKYMGELKGIIHQEFNNPTIEFVKLLGKQVYDGQFTAKVTDQFTGLIRRAINLYINDIIAERLKKAADDTEKQEQTIQPEMPQESKESKTATTEEELQGYYIVKSIVRGAIDINRLAHRDAQSYFAILIDDNNRKPLCRLYLNSPTNKRLALFGDDKKEILYKISLIDDIYQYSEQLINTAKKYS